MPEGDTVHRTARRLAEALDGHEVTRFDLRVPRGATLDLRGEHVRHVVARGKHILERIGDHTLHSHLRMDGSWGVFAPGDRWRRPVSTVRAIVGTATRVTVGFDLAMVEVVRTADEERIVGHLGPDPLSADWDPVEAARRLHADARPVHVALLDQRNVAGFGNEYAAEMLFLLGVLPTRPAAGIDASALMGLGARAIRANVARRHRSFTGDARPGRATWVYGREGEPCRRCGTAIRRGALGASAAERRVVFWCPSCQT